MEPVFYQIALQQCKTRLKKWELDFHAQYSRVPSKSDVQKCPSIHLMYRQYASLKVKVAKGNLPRGKENQSPSGKNHMKSVPSDGIVNESLVPLQQNFVSSPNTNSSSEDSGGSHISATPPKSIPADSECRLASVESSRPIRRPLQLISSNDKNVDRISSAPKNKSGSRIDRNLFKMSAVEDVGDVTSRDVAPSLHEVVYPASPLKKSAVDVTIDLTSREAAPYSFPKVAVPACPLGAEQGFTIRLHRHGEQHQEGIRARPNVLLPAGFFARLGPSTVRMKDSDACGIPLTKDELAEDDEGGNAANFVLPDCEYKEGRSRSKDNSETHECVREQQPWKYSFDLPLKEIGQSGEDCTSSDKEVSPTFFTDLLSKVVLDDYRNPAVTERDSTSDLPSLLDDGKVHQKMRVMCLKEKLLKLGLPRSGSKSTLITRLEEAMLVEKKGRQSCKVDDVDPKSADNKENEGNFKSQINKQSLMHKGDEELIIQDPAIHRSALSSMTLGLVKRNLLQRGFSSTGSKSVLVARLDKALATEWQPVLGEELLTKACKTATRENGSEVEHSKKDQAQIVDSEPADGQKPVASGSARLPSSSNSSSRRVTRSMHSPKEFVDEFLDGTDSNDQACQQGLAAIPSEGKRNSRKRARDPCRQGKGVSSSNAHELDSGSSPMSRHSKSPKDPSTMVGKTAVKASKKRIKLSDPLHENSWARPKALQTRSRKVSTSKPSQPSKRPCGRPGERENYVKMNLNGRGRKHGNGTRTKQPGAYGGRSTGRMKYRRKGHTGGQNDGVLATGNKRHTLWANDGWLENGLHPDVEDFKSAKETQLAVRLKEIVDEVQKNPSDQHLMELLDVGFGFKSFRGGQMEAIRRVISMKSTMLILPTGAGKSLCYQLPAYILPGITLVISPLVALMNDQLRHLPPLLPGALISSAQTSQESSATIARVRAGQVKILFISPERLSSKSFLCILEELPKVSLAVIDEAHCVSEWSHNFRSSYLRLGKVLQERMQGSCTLAMTATATKKAEQAILKSLAIPADGVVQASYMRKNLLLSVSIAKQDNSGRLKSLLAMLQSSPYLDAQSIIIYCTFQIETDNVSGFLQQNGIQAQNYHAKKSSQERARIQDLFIRNKLRVVVATMAFGMGLDKSDVRAIVHYNMPRSLEQYVQETGRAGRDGSNANCHLFLQDKDYLKLRSLAYSDGVDAYSVSKFLRQVFEGGLSSTGSIIIETGSRELDMKEEVMETILSFLEAEELKYVKILSKLYVTCSLSFQKSSPQSLAGRNAFIAAVVKRSKEKQGLYVFDLPSIATMLQLSLHLVQSELWKLQAAGEITFEVRDQAVCFKVLQIPPDICFLTSTITARLTEAEECQVRKIDAMYIAASTSMQSMTAVNSQESVSSIQQASFQTSIKLYFETEEDPFAAQNAPSIIQAQSTFVVHADIKALLRSTRHITLTGRAIARIFHGLWSPAFPAAEWKDNHFWSTHEGVDFAEIKRVAAGEILRQRQQQS